MSRSPWLTACPSKARTRLRLFCVPYAGASASIFHAWRAMLEDDIELCLVHLPGRSQRVAEAPHERLDGLIDALVPELETYLSVPFALFGHSVGGLIAFELARRLRRTARPMPTRLLVSACRAPQLPARTRPLHGLPTSLLIEQLRELGGTPEEMLANDELLGIVLPTLRADFALAETYIYREEPPLGCDVRIFGGLGDAVVPYEDLAPWHTQTSGAFSMDLFPNGHFFINDAGPEFFRLLAARLA